MRYLLWKLQDMSSEVRSPRDLDLHGLGAVASLISSLITEQDFVDIESTFECCETVDSGCGRFLVLLRANFWFQDCFGVDDCV